MEFHKERNSDRSNNIVSFSLSLSSLVAEEEDDDDDEDDDELIRGGRGKQPCRPDPCSGGVVTPAAWFSSTTARVVVVVEIVVVVFPGPSSNANRRRFLIGREINFGAIVFFFFVDVARLAVVSDAVVATLVLIIGVLL